MPRWYNRRWRWWKAHEARMAFGVLAVVSVAGSVWVSHQNRENHHLIALVQSSRLEACRDVNARHDEVTRRLGQLTDQAKHESPARAERIEASRRSTMILINALAPKRDCRTFVSPPNLLAEP